MFTIISKVDRNTGNYEDVFRYTLNASFSGTEGDIESAKIQMYIPEYMDIYLGDIEKPVKEVREEEVEGGKNVIFDFGEVKELGVAVRIGFGLVFNNLAQSGQKFELLSEFYVNGEKKTEYLNEEIELIVNPRFEILREMILPTIEPSPNSEVYYKVILQNFEDLGGEIKNIEMRFTGTENLILDDSFPVIGKDNSSKFKDERNNGVEGVIENNELIFNLPEYAGEKYEYIYKAKITDGVEVGDEIVTNGTWSIENVEQETDVNKITIGEEVVEGTIFCYGPDYTLENEHIGYEINIENSGNQALEGVYLREILPQEIQYYRFKTGTFHFAEINLDIDAEYIIEYTTVNGEEGQLGPFNTNINSTVDLTEVLDEGDNVLDLKWNIERLGVGISTKNKIEVDGIVKVGTPINTTIINSVELRYDEEIYVINSKNTLVQDTCVLTNIFEQDGENIPVKPGTVVKYSIGANCRMSRLNNPVIGIVIPKELEYIGNEKITYKDEFVDSKTPEIPVPEKIENINENGDTLIKYWFTDEYAFDFRQKSKMNIEIETKVKIGAKGEFDVFSILNTTNTSKVIPDDSEIYRYNGEVYAKSETKSTRILFFVATQTNKKVKGQLDAQYLEAPLVGKTLPGGKIEYKIDITNIGNVELEKIEIVDILPYIGDTGVITTNTERGSQFKVYAIEEVYVEILGKEEVEFDVEYSESYDPVRFGPEYNIIGTDDNWKNELPEDLTKLHSLKITTKNTALNPNEILEIKVIAIAPNATPVGLVAWNSFAADIMYRDLEGIETNMLATEPEKVGIEVMDFPEDKGQIKGYTWFDKNKNGLPDDDEDGINDIGVVLVDEFGISKEYTFTSKDFEENDGYYSFGNLDFGKYYLKFFKDPSMMFTKRNEDINGSHVNPETNYSDEIELTLENKIVTVNGGLIKKSRIEISKLLEVNKSVNKTMTNIVRNQLLITMKMEDASKLILDNK